MGVKDLNSGFLASKFCPLSQLNGAHLTVQNSRMMRTPWFKWWHLVAIIVSFLAGWHMQGYHHNYLKEEDFIRARVLESEAIWSRGVEARHAAEIESPLSDTNPWQHVDYRLPWDFFYPNFNCPQIFERIGRVGDGGKWVCGLSQIKRRANPCVVYSYGVSGDTSFEEEILARTNCTLHAYDHTVKAKQVKVTKLFPSRATFSKLGLGTDNKGSLRTLKSQMDMRGHKYIDILKIDVEGAEFNVLRQILSDFQDGLPFGQLLIELHLRALPQDGMFKHLKSWWEALESAGLRAFHNEPNLFVFGNGAKNPSYYEVSFLNVRVDNLLLHG